MNRTEDLIEGDGPFIVRWVDGSYLTEVDTKREAQDFLTVYVRRIRECPTCEE